MPRLLADDATHPARDAHGDGDRDLTMVTLHVHPLGDIIDHDTSTTEPDCIGGPTVHHSLDGREREERQ